MADSADLYRTVRLIRRFEEQAIEMVRSGVITGGIHPYIGEEAIAAGVCAALRPDDLITSTHRGHGHVLAKGGDPVRMLAELAGRETGLNGGRGGSMHAADVSAGIYGANAIVGASAAIACGAAWSHRRAGHDRVAVTFFGDGAVNQGVLLEALNLASLRRLPVIFVCENNSYAISVPIRLQTANPNIAERASGYGITGITVDGTDVPACFAAAREAVARARSGEGPTLIDAKIWRINSHTSEDNQTKYRSREEMEDAARHDPITRFTEWLIERRWMTAAAAAEVQSECDREASDAADWAEQQPDPLPEDALKNVFA
jgi:acetoin:2,6-dichlorophenolindophenol oxidoreductase subunit alpha